MREDPRFVFLIEVCGEGGEIEMNGRLWGLIRNNGCRSK